MAEYLTLLILLNSTDFIGFIAFNLSKLDMLL